MKVLCVRHTQYHCLSDDPEWTILNICFVEMRRGKGTYIIFFTKESIQRGRNSKEDNLLLLQGQP